MHDSQVWMQGNGSAQRTPMTLCCLAGWSCSWLPCDVRLAVPFWDAALCGSHNPQLGITLSGRAAFASVTFGYNSIGSALLCSRRGSTTAPLGNAPVRTPPHQQCHDTVTMCRSALLGSQLLLTGCQGDRLCTARVHCTFLQPLSCALERSQSVGTRSDGYVCTANHKVCQPIGKGTCLGSR
jgi:hypothetical protein